MDRSPTRLPALVLTIASLSCVVASAQSDWSMFGGNPQHTGQNTADTGAPPATLAWSVPLMAGGALSPAVVQGGRVCVSGKSISATMIWTRDAATGAPLWSYSRGSVTTFGHPTLVNGRVYVQESLQSVNPRLLCLDAPTGAVVWSSTFADQHRYYWAPTVEGESVFINGGYTGGMYRFSTTGSQRWFSQLAFSDEWSPAFDNGIVYSFTRNTSPATLRAHDASTGAVNWSVDIPWSSGTGYRMNTAPVVGGGLIYVIAPPNLSAVDPSTGAVVWSTSGTSCSGTPAYANAVVYSLSAGSLDARTAASGALLWTFPGDSALSYPPVVANGSVYIASPNNVYAVEASTGAQAWTAVGGGWLSIADRALYVASSSGTLSAYDLTFGTPPTVPALVSPAEGASIAGTSATLAWDSSTDDIGVADYVVEVADDPAFAGVRYSAVVTSTGATTNALPDGVHSWRVRARDPAGARSPWSAARTFRTDDGNPPTVPPPLQPDDGAIVQGIAWLRWGASTDAGFDVPEYDAQVASDAAFSTVEWQTTLAATSTSSGVLPEGTHYWRVRARDRGGSPSAWSPVRTFLVDIVPPSSPVATTPDDGAVEETSMPTLAWNASSDNVGLRNYEFEMATDAGFSNAQRYGYNSSTSVTLYRREGLYYWRVRAFDQAGNVSAWSAPRSFTVDSFPPSTPSPSSPADGVFVGTAEVPLSWGASADPATGIRDYDVQVASESAFSAVEWSATQIQTATTTGTLPAGLHYWRVRARSGTGRVSEWSYRRRFTLDMGTLAARTAWGPVDAASVRTPRPYLAWNATSEHWGVTYEVEIATSNPILPPLTASIQGLSSPSWMASYLPNGTYYWHVRATDGAGSVGAWSATWSFVVSGAASVPTTGDWVCMTPANSPGPRRQHAMAFDPISQRILLFGGWPGWPDTWAWDGVNWTRLSPAHPPPGRYAHAMCTDTTRGRIVLFGGRTYSTMLGDTWEWDGTDWIQRAPAHSPTPRWGAAMAYDPARQRVVLFGGCGTRSAVLNAILYDETWEWDGVDWTLRAIVPPPYDGDGPPPDPNRPPAFVSVSMTHDPGSNRILLWGGGPYAGRYTEYAGAWEFDGVEWRYIGGIGERDGGGYSGAGLVYDANREGAILFGGSDPRGSGLWQSGSMPDTWDFPRRDGWSYRWGQVITETWPLPRPYVAMAFDPVRRRTVMFGGGGGSGFDVYWPYSTFNDTWELDARRRGEEIILSPGEAPGSADLDTSTVPGEGGVEYVEGPSMPWTQYLAMNGEMRAACGNLDGDPLDEVVIGLGTYPQAGGWLAIEDDAEHGFRLLRWIRIPWSLYNATDGQTRPTCGNFDEDEREEIVVGLGPYPLNGGWIAVFDDEARSCAFSNWVRVGWAAYNAANGETRPVAGQLDGDARDELLVGFGRNPQSGGWLQVRDDRLASWAHRSWARLSWTGYNQFNGATWPALGNVDEDALDEVFIGEEAFPGRGGWVRVLDDPPHGFAPLKWLHVPWAEYQAYSGETRPAVIDVDGDGRGELVVGLGPYPGVGGYYVIWEEPIADPTDTEWERGPDPTYNSENGEYWPTGGDVH